LALLRLGRARVHSCRSGLDLHRGFKPLRFAVYAGQAGLSG
jgi:hypothetical protein